MPAPAARLGDPMMHGPPLLGAPCVTVLIGGKPGWRAGDMHNCTMVNLPPPAGPGTPHLTGITAPSIPNVLVGGKPASRLVDMVTEPGAVVPLPPPNPILMGAPTVLL